MIGRLEASVGCEYSVVQANPCDKGGSILENLILKSLVRRPRKASKGYSMSNRTKTDTGRRVEYTKALGRILVKELCKMAP